MNSITIMQTCPKNPLHVRELNDRGRYYCRECARENGRRGGKAAQVTLRKQREGDGSEAGQSN